MNLWRVQYIQFVVWLLGRTVVQKSIFNLLLLSYNYLCYALTNSMHRMCQGRTDLYSVKLDVEMTRCATEIGREQVARSLVEPYHASLVQRSRSDHDQVSTVFFQSWVLLVDET